MRHKKLIVIITLLIFVATSYLFFFYHQQEIYQVKDGTVSYTQDRGKPDYQIVLSSKGETYDIYNITFLSRPFLQYSTTIYALLYLPKIAKQVPALIYLPGGGVPKEGAATLSTFMVKEGYAVLVLDQRGIGQTEGYFLSLDDDYKVFSQGKEPIQHLAVFDVLKAFDVLRAVKEIDQKNIALVGESMGGRFALVAAALDNRIKGVIAISTSGYHVTKDVTKPGNEFLLSIDPDQYINKIAPRPLFMLHSKKDSIVPYASAQQTFILAKEPKNFFTAENCDHGFCQEMQEALKKDLKDLFH